jgi:hypothetical protein
VDPAISSAASGMQLSAYLCGYATPLFGIMSAFGVPAGT